MTTGSIIIFYRRSLNTHEDQRMVKSSAEGEEMRGNYGKGEVSTRVGDDETRRRESADGGGVERRGKNDDGVWGREMTLEVRRH